MIKILCEKDKIYFTNFNLKNLLIVCNFKLFLKKAQSWKLRKLAALNTGSVMQRNHIFIVSTHTVHT